MSIWDWSYVWEALPYLYLGAIVTVQATVLSFAIALVLGLIIALIRQSPNRYVSTAMTEIVESIRSTPLLLQVFFVYFVGPQFGILIPAWTAGIGMLGIHYAAYCSEVYRAGILAVEEGQWEACTALNLSRIRTWRTIILPQAIPPIVPALGNYFVGMFKETPILAAIAILEMLQQAKIFGANNYRYTEAIVMVGFFFLVFSLAASAIVQSVSIWLNRRYRLQ
ncbi:ectoine/hydroxyectoine ABC transporter permease subunit EhuD [Mesorhizobium sp. M1A.F.Ca.IN.022.07.1.1]|uniref:ectoine/hydroxyectoine ABC transporter permease subunit EhuD n=1 Tax=unclassified Mesorhizobium TaxID=325217 RepID=UPI000FCB1F25|nr:MULTISPECIES: ectoine/hydroxyectoine ABC transporter permease subunit EhuD [unclassified Mesorhizobium]RUV90801.1 ectoine/hydroxyectoine ABC transporter permease subunit EhuD [Mesorhizobium sp. M1A.F.Ca.IN.022.07.1.1]RWM65319.1 MAG: ectoine/hydroxyectoine ABC transporter permease subunit EhuD [Mesorhizobium sp.]RWM90511.1 MAG: ectoine/hydroxyectoine ABC transporter permease subunit EhuD [Mesorhizobium sp.]TIS71198.1 MAG: ectoine/hydroxyectoine ABC transporter permease subunit EhuD [Mesorhizo